MSASAPNQLQLVGTRTIPAIDAESLEFFEAKEALFRDGDSFILYLSDGVKSCRKERLISLGPREALLWLNEDQAEAGSFWQ